MEDGEKGEDHDVFVVIYPSTGLSIQPSKQQFFNCAKVEISFLCRVLSGGRVSGAAPNYRVHPGVALGPRAANDLFQQDP